MLVNDLTITGNVGKDAEDKTLPSGVRLVSFSLGHSAGKGDYKKTQWFTVKVFDREGLSWLLDLMAGIRKGDRVIVKGRLGPVRTYQKQDGTVGVDQEIIAQSVGVLAKDNAPRHTEEAPADPDIPF